LLFVRERPEIDARVPPTIRDVPEWD